MSSSKLKIAHLVLQVLEKRFPFESNIRASCGVPYSTLGGIDKHKLKVSRNGLEPGIDSDVAKLIVDDRHFGCA